MSKHFIGYPLLAILLTVPASADVTVGFTSISLSGWAGQTLTFGGTLTNETDSTVSIGGAGLNLAGFDETDYDLTDFLTYAPWTLDAGETSGAFDFFTVTIPSGLSADSYAGTLVVQGGIDGNDTLGSAGFTVEVEPEVAGVPEPGAWLLLVTLLAAVGTMQRLRRLRT